MNKLVLVALLSACIAGTQIAQAKSIGSSGRSSSSSSFSRSAPAPSKPANTYAGGYQRSDLPKAPAAAVPPKPTVTPPVAPQQPSMIGSNAGKPQQTYTPPTESVRPTQSSGMSTGAQIATGVALGAIGGAVLANTMSGPSHNQTNPHQQQAQVHNTQATHAPSAEYAQGAHAPQVVYQQAPVQQVQPQVQVVERTIVKEVPVHTSSGGSGFFWFILIVALLAASVGYYYVTKRPSTKKKFDEFRKASREFAGSVGDEAAKDFKAKQAQYNDAETQKPISSSYPRGQTPVYVHVDEGVSGKDSTAIGLFGTKAGTTSASVVGGNPGDGLKQTKTGDMAWVPPTAADGGLTRNIITLSDAEVICLKFKRRVDPVSKFNEIQFAFADGDKEVLKGLLTESYYNEILPSINAVPEKVTVRVVDTEVLLPDEKVISILYTYVDTEDNTTYQEYWHFDLYTYALAGIQPV